MAYVITAPCIDVKDAACQTSCPVECIYEGGRMMYIHPDECINCGLCLSVCPVQAIYAEEDLPKADLGYIAVNAEFFGPQVTGWGSPGGVDTRWKSTLDHPAVKDHPKATTPG